MDIIDDAAANGDYATVFGTINKLLGERAGVSDSIIAINDANGVLISTKSGKFARWREYFNDLYNSLGYDHTLDGASTSTASPSIDATIPLTRSKRQL